MDSKRPVAMVTGGGGGIGSAIAHKLAATGHVLAVVDLKQEAAERTAAEIRNRAGAASAYALDVSDPDQVGAVAEQIVTDHSRLNVLVNCAGIQLNCATADLPPADYLRVLGVNLNGSFFCAQAAGRQMIKQGGGVVINISSLASNFGWPRRMPYAISKAGVVAMTRSLAVEWAQFGVRVVAIAPGYVATDLVKHAFEQRHINPDTVLGEIPQRRLAAPEEIAEVAAFLASPGAGYITGQEIVVDGGFSVFKL